MNDTLEPPQQTDTDNTVMPVDTNESITNWLMFGEGE
jgi:hypothetical protein